MSRKGQAELVVTEVATAAKRTEREIVNQAATTELCTYNTFLIPATVGHTQPHAVTHSHTR